MWAALSPSFLRHEGDTSLNFGTIVDTAASIVVVATKVGREFENCSSLLVVCTFSHFDTAIPFVKVVSNSIEDMREISHEHGASISTFPKMVFGMVSPSSSTVSMFRSSGVVAT